MKQVNNILSLSLTGSLLGTLGETTLVEETGGGTIGLFVLKR